MSDIKETNLFQFANMPSPTPRASQCISFFINLELLPFSQTSQPTKKNQSNNPSKISWKSLHNVFDQVENFIKYISITLQYLIS